MSRNKKKAIHFKKKWWVCDFCLKIVLRRINADLLEVCYIIKPPLQSIPTSSPWLQLCCPHGGCIQSANDNSIPSQATLSSQIGSASWPSPAVKGGPYVLRIDIYILHYLKRQKALFICAPLTTKIQG